MSELDSLEQVLQEEVYSRKKVRGVIKNWFLEHNDQLITLANKHIAEFMSEDFTYVKDGIVHPKELQLLVDELVLCFENNTVNMDDLIVEVLTACIESEETQLFAAVVSKIKKLFPYEEELACIKMSCHFLSVLCNTDIYDILKDDNGQLWIKSNIQFDESIKQYIASTMYIPPFICKPKEVTSNNSCGYYTEDVHVILKKYNQHDLEVPLDVLNILNAIELCLDEHVLEYHEEFKWKKKHESLTEADKQEIQVQFDFMQQVSDRIYQDILDRGNYFYENWCYDARLRMYMRGYHVNIQSTEFKKALVNIKHFEHVELTRTTV